MPAQSKQQQKFMGMVHALKKGDMKPSDASPELKKAAQSMSDKDAKDFASTSHKGLPKKVKQEILNKLKEYANSMGRDHLGGDDYTSSKKGGLRDFDGYDNVDYNKDMSMDEGFKSEYKGNDGIIWKKGKTQGGVTNFTPYYKGHNIDFGGHNFKTEKELKDFIKNYILSIQLYNKYRFEGKLPNNWMQGRVSDYHTSLRGKKKDYSGGTNFRTDNSGQEDLEEGDLEDTIHQVKKFDKPKDGKLLTIKVINKLKDKRNKSKSISNKEKLQKMIDTIEGEYKKGKYIKEYGQRLDLSYLEDEEARLDGTPKPKDAIDRNIDETMIRRASDIAQKLIPMDTWSRHASFQDGGKKNKEFVKNIVRDLAQSLNRFYKSHDINVRIQENEGDSNVDMVLGVLSILRQIDDKENRKRVAVDMIKKFKEQDIDFDYQEFIDLMKEYSMGSYEYSK
jgi:hypothetical protein